MKTLTILLIGVAATITQPAMANHRQSLQGPAQQAQLLAAHLAAATTPYAPYNASWARAARRAVETNHATESLAAALAMGDYCTARDVAERLKDLADDLEDSIEDLRPLPGGPCDHDIHSLEEIADDLDKLAGLLRRETRRLDVQQVVIAPPIAPICAPVTPPCVGPPVNDYHYDYGANYPQPRQRGDVFPSRPYPVTPYHSFGTGVPTPSTDIYGRDFSGTGSRNHNNEYAWPNNSGSVPSHPGLGNPSTFPPGQLKKIDPSQFGPMFPGASRQLGRLRVSFR